MYDSYIGANGKNRKNPINPTASKSTISVFELTVWAYRRQMVQYEPRRQLEVAAEYGIGPGFRADFVEDLLAGLDGHAVDRTGRGCVRGEGASADARAHVVHAHVRQLPSSAQIQIIKAGEKAAPPNWDPYVAPFRCRPQWNGAGGRLERIDGKMVARGKFRKWWSNKGKPLGCYLVWHGTPPAIAAAIREQAHRDYATWWDGLARLEPGLSADPRLAAFAVEGVGAKREPWREK